MKLDKLVVGALRHQNLHSGFSEKLRYNVQ